MTILMSLEFLSTEPKKPFSDLIGDSGLTMLDFDAYIRNIDSVKSPIDPSDVTFRYLMVSQRQIDVGYGASPTLSLMRMTLSDTVMYDSPEELIAAECDTIDVVNQFDLARQGTLIARETRRGAGYLYEGNVVAYSGPSQEDRPIFRSLNLDFSGYMYVPHPNIRKMLKIIKT